MKCLFEPTEKPGVHRCIVCGFTTMPTTFPPARVHRECVSRGLGDTVARAAAALGVKKCGGCEKRQEVLNKLLPYRSDDGETQR